ncbi:MAG: NACHT domain-containing protein [Halothece sp.]
MVIPPEFLKKFTKRLGVSDGELEVLLDSLEGEDLSAIAQRLGIQRNALQKRLGEVYKKFNIDGTGPGKFAKLQKILLEEYEKYINNREGNQDSTESNHFQWGDAPVVKTFADRATELTQAQDFLIQERSPLVAVLGMAGIGKSVFAVRLVEQIASNYDYVIWRNLSLRSVPILETLLTDLMRCFPSSQETEADTPPVIGDLIQQLQRDRCLIILDQFETLFQENNWAGYYQSGYENYGELLKQITQTHHQSSLLLLSRETPLELISLTGGTPTTAMITLKGLTRDGIEQILSEQGLNCQDDTIFSQFLDHYSGHPVAINELAITVQTLFAGNFKDLLQDNSIFVGEIMSHYFSQQLQRLSPLEKEVIEHLALTSEGLTLQDIQNNCSEKKDLSYIMAALNSLNRRCLLEKFTDKETTRFTIIPSLKKHISLQLQS